MAYTVVKNGDGLGRERLIVWDGVGSLPTTHQGATIDADMQAIDSSSPGDRYVFDGTQWIRTSTGGAASVASSSSSEWLYGNYPETKTQVIAGTAPDVNDNTIVYESGDVSAYNHHSFSIVTAPGSGAVEVLITHDGTNYEATPIQVKSDALVNGAVIESVNEMTAVGNYHFTRKVKGWKLQNKGATTGAATVIRGLHSVI